MAAIRTHSLPGRPRAASSAPASFRVELSDGLATTVHLAAYDLRETDVRVVVLRDMEPLLAWCGRAGIDITAGRHPRAALGVAGRIALSVTCDGRSPHDAGLTLGELAELLVALGARAAVNLDGGGSSSQVCGMRMVNQPREQDGDEIPGGRPICTAVTFTPRPVWDPAPAGPAPLQRR